MLNVKGIVLEQNDRRITVFTENGEFKTYRHHGRVQPGQTVVKREYGELMVYAIMVLLLFALTVAVFYALVLSSS